MRCIMGMTLVACQIEPPIGFVYAECRGLQSHFHSKPLTKVALASFRDWLSSEMSHHGEAKLCTPIPQNPNAGSGSFGMSQFRTPNLLRSMGTRPTNAEVVIPLNNNLLLRNDFRNPAMNAYEHLAAGVDLPLPESNVRR